VRAENRECTHALTGETSLKEAPRRKPGDNAGRFGIDAASSPCLRMGAWMVKPSAVSDNRGHA